jgi:hypothetical protein
VTRASWRWRRPATRWRQRVLVGPAIATFAAACMGGGAPARVAAQPAPSAPSPSAPAPTTSPPAPAAPAPVQPAPGVPAPVETIAELRATLGRAIQRFDALDSPGVLAFVSDQYRTGPLTKPALREQLNAVVALYDAVKARVTIDEVRMVGDHAWVYSTGEVSGRLRFVGQWVVFLSWTRELEVARLESGSWRLFGYQQ